MRKDRSWAPSQGATKKLSNQDKCFTEILKMSKISAKICDEMKQKEFTFIAGGSTKWYSHFGGQFVSFLEN